MPRPSRPSSKASAPPSSSSNSSSHIKNRSPKGGRFFVYGASKPPLQGESHRDDRFSRRGRHPAHGRARGRRPGRGSGGRFVKRPYGADGCSPRRERSPDRSGGNGLQIYGGIRGCLPTRFYRPGASSAAGRGRPALRAFSACRAGSGALVAPDSQRRGHSRTARDCRPWHGSGGRFVKRPYGADRCSPRRERSPDRSVVFCGGA